MSGSNYVKAAPSAAGLLVIHDVVASGLQFEPVPLETVYLARAVVEHVDLAAARLGGAPAGQPALVGPLGRRGYGSRTASMSAARMMRAIRRRPAQACAAGQ